jgi:hypothetical protein
MRAGERLTFDPVLAKLACTSIPPPLDWIRKVITSDHMKIFAIRDVRMGRQSVAPRRAPNWPRME